MEVHLPFQELWLLYWNNQSEDGISIPDVLIPYTGFDTINYME
jgi:seryl-tRNA synthetase